MARARANPSTPLEHSWTGEKLSLLAVFAHPDDESFGPAGTLAKYASEGVDVSLATATRPAPFDGVVSARDRLCSCRTSGIRRVCLLDCPPGELDQVDPEIVEERLVRLMREIQPQVVITFGPEGLAGGSDYHVLNRAATAAFRDAGNLTKFQHHFHDGLGPYAPQKLYYCVLPQSLVARWGVQVLFAVPDESVTAILDVSSYTEAMLKALYCQRNAALDFIRWLIEEQRVQWDSEYYALVESTLSRKPRREKDLFAGLR